MDVVRVPRNTLVLIAGLVWCAAGGMIDAVGLPLELRLAPGNLALVPLAVAIFLAFYALIFSRLVRKHTRRIRAQRDDRPPIWSFFDRSSWAVMAVMVAGGLALRASHAVPDWMIAFFYSGLGTALLLSGLRFLGAYVRRDAST